MLALGTAPLLYFTQTDAGKQGASRTACAVAGSGCHGVENYPVTKGHSGVSNQGNQFC
jgi:hypothetical protein